MTQRYLKSILQYLLPSHSTDFFLCNLSSVLIEGLLYARPSITVVGSNCQNIGPGKVLKLQVAETHATRFRTRATTTPKADHITSIRNILSLLELYFYVDHLTFPKTLYDSVDTVVWLHWAPTISATMAVDAFKGTATLLIVIHIYFDRLSFCYRPNTLVPPFSFLYGLLLSTAIFLCPSAPMFARWSATSLCFRKMCFT